MEWFGERTPGLFSAYERMWMKDGISVTVADPAFIARNFCRYASWDAMRGMGVCGLAFEKPEPRLGGTDD